MREAIRKAIEARVKVEMRIRLPEFELIRNGTIGEDKRTLTFRRRFDPPRLDTFVLCKLLDSEAIETLVGWSELASPKLSGSKVDWTYRAEALCKRQIFVHTATLANRPSLVSFPIWNPPDSLLDNPEAFGEAYSLHYCRDLTPEEADVVVNDSVVQALDEVIDEGIPFLDDKLAHMKPTRSA